METLYKAIAKDGEIFSSPDQQTALRKAIEQLPFQERSVIVLYFEKGKGVKQIAKELNYSSSTVYNRLNRALIILKHQFNPSSFDKMYRILYPETGKPGSMLTTVS